jgi:multidrug/hemolysin transport system permease protein
MFFVAMFVHSDSAWSGLGTIVGTLVGFVGAIYLPMGMLPEAVQNVLKWLPFLHGTSMMRKVFTEDALEITFKGLPEQVLDGYQTYMGINIWAYGGVLNNLIQIACVVGFGVAALMIATFILRKRAIGDR